MHRAPDQTADTKPAPSADRFSLVYVGWVGLAFLLFLSAADLDRVLHLYVLLIPLVVIPALAVLVCWTAALMRNVALRRWRGVVSVLAAPVVVYTLYMLADASGVNPQRIRLELGRQYYVKEIAKLAPCDEPRLKLFDWGQSGGAGITSLIYTLVFDEADEIALPAERRSPAWRDRAAKLCPGTPMCALLWTHAATTAVKKIEGHFYLLTEVY